MPLLSAVLSLLIAVRFVFKHPLIAILGSAVLFYVLMPANHPSAARFGKLDPTQEADHPTPVPALVRRALPVTDQSVTTPSGTIALRLGTDRVAGDKV